MNRRSDGHASALRQTVILKKCEKRSVVKGREVKALPVVEEKGERRLC